MNKWKLRFEKIKAYIYKVIYKVHKACIDKAFQVLELFENIDKLCVIVSKESSIHWSHLLTETIIYFLLFVHLIL